jgi:hypothetical protein
LYFTPSTAGKPFVPLESLICTSPAESIFIFGVSAGGGIAPDGGFLTYVTPEVNKDQQSNHVEDYIDTDAKVGWRWVADDPVSETRTPQLE